MKHNRTTRYQPTEEQMQALATIRSNVINPERWAVAEDLLEVIKIPSLRGMAYGYVAEYEFTKHLTNVLGITEYYRDDDHKKTKSDLNFTYQERVFSA
ncbi:hypothetical protein [Candidatus Viridilinea mediisalina]|uniref:Uncharacterized protein n=1 Tax=Candidatus Viridilinea mediisalina TaxID=2024553 RepID=A0A2A6RL38_9CHLR|nr:hypothetical protein [Candidatus Viridilinea mediisalina]PDW03625.1 hypothetical protein CJ255_07715 [Candidatus Viridilinea mediisalina]